MSEPQWESNEVTDNKCVKELTALVDTIKPYYKQVDQYIFELTDRELSERLINDFNRLSTMTSEIMVALSIAHDINSKVQGIYDRVRDAVNKALENNTIEVEINATDDKYGGCMVSTESAKSILDEMLDQKNDAETMIDFIYKSYNDILVPKFPNLFKPHKRDVNQHCVKDADYFARQTAYEKVYAPMSKKISELRAENEPKWHYNIRKWLGSHGNIYTANTLQTYVDAVYNAWLEGDEIKTSMIKDNCYRSLTDAEYKWVMREVKVRYEKNKIDVYQLDHQKERCKKLCELLFRWLFGYGWTANGTMSIDTYKNDMIELIDTFDVGLMMMFMTIPELCIFAFPTDDKSAYIHNVTLKTVQHSVDYNLNWELDAAYMYWFWTHIQGEGYAPTTDQEGNPKNPPEEAKPAGFNYFEEVFKVKLKKLSNIMADKLLGNNGIYKGLTGSDLKYSPCGILAPWIIEFFGEDVVTSYDKRNVKMRDMLDSVGEMNIRKFVSWVHENVIYNIPKYVWKSFNAMTGTKSLQDVPILFVPNNFTLFDAEYELETGILTALNSIYWLYGYIVPTTDDKLDAPPKITATRDFIYQGGLCYKLANNPVEFNVTFYEPFELIWNPKYDKALYKRTEQPAVDIDVFKYNQAWLFEWKTAGHSFLIQGIDNDIRPIVDEDRIPHIGARCKMLPYKSYIIAELLTNYLNATGCPYGKIANPCLVTFADHIAGNSITNGNTLLNVLFNGTVRHLLRCHLTFPYNNVLSTNFINTVHFNWYNMSHPGETGNWNNVVIPQYIFSESPNEKNMFNKRTPDKSKYSSTILPTRELPLPYVKNKVGVTFYKCVNWSVKEEELPIRGQTDCAFETNIKYK